MLVYSNVCHVLTFLETSTSTFYLVDLFRGSCQTSMACLINWFSFLNEDNTVISINQCSLNGKPFLWTIVSRRCCFRAGTRLFARGIDVQGNVANFVETEQIVEFGGDKSSFVQVSTLNICNELWWYTSLTCI